jgi:hypothetical protein
MAFIKNPWARKTNINQNDKIQSIHKEHKKRLGAMESRHKAIRSLVIMELQVCPTMMTNYRCQFVIDRMLKHSGKRARASPPVTAVSQTRTSFFNDEDHYLIELAPQHMNDHGRVKMA